MVVSVILQQRHACFWNAFTVTTAHSNVLVVAYLDVITLVGDAKDVEAAAKMLGDGLARLGIELNRKCEWLAADGSVAPGFVAPKCAPGMDGTADFELMCYCAQVEVPKIKFLALSSVYT
jgi:hypothetical protein